MQKRFVAAAEPSGEPHANTRSDVQKKRPTFYLLPGTSWHMPALLPSAVACGWLLQWAPLSPCAAASR